MKKGVAMWTVTAEMLMDCGNFMLVALNFSLIRFLKFKNYGTFTYITHICHSNAHLNPIKGIFSDKTLMIAEILNFQFAVILNSKET